MIRPAFSSTWQAAVFALMVLMLLLLPLMVSKSSLPPREELYTEFWWANGPFPYISQQIFEEKSDIDIAFVGSSHMLHGINTPQVEEELSKKLRRPAVVRSICWGGAGFDALYFITQDLLQHRKVHMMVFYDDYNPGWFFANALAPRWFRWEDNAEAVSGLPFRYRICYYFAAVIGMPRNLLSIVRANIPVNLISKKKNYLETTYKAPNPVLRLGSISAHVGFGLDPAPTEFNAPFVDFTPPTDDLSSQVVTYSPETQAEFKFQGEQTPLLPRYFARKFAAQAQAFGTKLVFLHLPISTDARNPLIQEREFWPDLMQADITMVGIPPAKLFAGLTDDQVHELYYNYAHLNKNGQEFFTSIITPRLLDIYETPTSH